MTKKVSRKFAVGTSALASGKTRLFATGSLEELSRTHP